MQKEKRMFKALGRLFKAIIYTFTFQFNKLAELWGSSPGAIAASYDSIKSKHQASIQQVKTAVASIMALQEKKKKRLEVLAGDVERHRQLIAGAQAKAKKVVALLQAAGATQEVIKTNADYVKCSAAFKDFSSTLVAKEQEAQTLTEEIEEAEAQLADYKAQLDSMVRDLKKIDQEKHETIADVEISRQQQEANDLIAGISRNNSAEERLRLQEMRNRLKAEAKISRELAGVNADRAEQEFLDYAITSEASSEFDRLMGLETSLPVSEPARLSGPSPVQNATYELVDAGLETVPAEKVLGPVKQG
jgi:chromosome segregation ATPase